MLAELAGKFVKIPRACIAPHAGRSIAFNFGFKPQEYLGIHRLWACITTPQTPGNGGKQKQRQRRDDQYTRQVNKVLGVQNEVKYVKPFGFQVKQHRLSVSPLQPRHAVKHQLGQIDHGPPPVVKATRDVAWVDFFMRLVQRDHLRVGIRRRLYGAFILGRDDGDDLGVSSFRIGQSAIPSGQWVTLPCYC